ncbi:putative membrane protein [Halorhabdus sp. SVX81]|uniref:hypothetical protein n=1 Tax=Halorhabdus sp. SVX81 TaxID=2978283 RepID=UPI0023DA67A3|nr:hypothetical protein [Halorhabdus sp. SVX81]WEL16238.1 putative membrane protein [Halorhabdus sp. SVX81]
MAAVAVANGVFHETALIDRVGEYPDHVLSTAMLVVAIIVVAAAYCGTTPIIRKQSCWPSARAGLS